MQFLETSLKLYVLDITSAKYQYILHKYRLIIMRSLSTFFKSAISWHDIQQLSMNLPEFTKFVQLMNWQTIRVNTTAITPKSEDKYVRKCSTRQSFIFPKWHSFKIGTLAMCWWNRFTVVFLVWQIHYGTTPSCEV